MGRVWFSVHSQSPLLQIERHANVMHLRKIVKMAASRAGTLLCYFKRGREDEENANTGDSRPTRVKKAKKDRDFKPAWKKDFVWFIVYNETEGNNVLPVLCKFSKQ